MAVTMTWLTVTNAPRILKLCCGRNVGKVLSSVPNVSRKNPSTISTRPSVATTWRAMALVTTRLAKNSKPKPRTTPSTSTAMTAATGQGTPCSTFRM